MLTMLLSACAFAGRRWAPPVVNPMMQMSSDRPAILNLPAGVESVDAITPEMLKGFSADDLEAAKQNLETSIFDLPPFDKPNEKHRRRMLALAYFIADPEANGPAILPNVKEVLRQAKGEDAEMQYILGVCLLSAMEGDSMKGRAILALERAIDLQPDYPEAKAALEAAKA